MFRKILQWILLSVYNYIFPRFHMYNVLKIQYNLLHVLLPSELSSWSDNWLRVDLILHHLRKLGTIVLSLIFEHGPYNRLHVYVQRPIYKH